MDMSIENCFDSHEVGEMQSMDETRLVASSLETLGESAVNPDVGQLGGDGVLTEGVKAERTHGHTNESGNSTEEAEDDDGDANDTDDSDSPSLNYELQQGYRILKELMAESNKSVNWPFIYKVDDSYPETSDYYEKIKNPIWLEKMKDKFAKREYETITQFIADFRLMLENCYRYNGPDHYVSKRGQKLETMMEQKLALLSREIREKTSIAATSGQHQREGSPFSGLRRRTRNIIPHDSTALLNQLREEEAQSLRDARKQQMLERKAAQEAYLQDLMGWESNMMDNKDKEMRAMWELPQIGLFLFLCQEPLNTGEISQFELERCFFMPRESSTMHLVMTSLLSTPFQRTRIDHKSLMSYRVWEEKLRVKLILWYKVFTDFNKDMDKAAEKLGLDPYFFQVVGKKNPLEKKKFHEIGVYKRIWIVKSLCEWCLEHQESIRDTIEAQPVEECRCYFLGTDAKGNSYIHFPQFCGADLRIYKQAALPDPTDFFEELIEKHAEVEKPPIVPFKTPIKEKIIKKTPSSKKPKKKKLKQSEIVTPPTNRPSRLRQKIKTVLPVVNDSSSSSSSDEEEDTAADDDGDDTVTEEQSDSAFNDSGISENTPAKRKRTHMNKRISKVLESELYSDSSSVDSENSAWRRRSSRLLKNGLMKEFKTIPFDIDLDETSCDKFDSVSENGLGMSEESRTDGKNLQEERIKNNSTPLSDATEFSFNNSESGDEIKTQNSISVDSKKSPKDANSKDDGAGDKSDCDEKYTFASCSTVDAKGDKVVDYKKLCDAIDSVMSNGLYGDSDDETSKDSSIGFSIDENAMNSDMEVQNKNGIADTDDLTNTDQFSIDIIKKENCDLDSNVLENEDSPMENNVCDRTDKENHDNSNVSCNSERTQNHSLVKPENPSCDSNSSVCNDSNLNLSTSENPLSENDKNVSDLHSKEMHEAESNENIKIKQEPIDDHEIQKDAIDGKEILSDFVKEPSGSQDNIKWEKKEGKNLDVRDENNDIINQDIDIKTEIKSLESMEVEEVMNHDKKPKDGSEEGNEKKEDTKLLGNKSMKKENDMETGSCEVKKENETESETAKADEEEMKETKEESEDEEEELFPEIGAFELIVQDVEGLRKLVEEFAEPEPVVIGSGKKQKVIKPPPRRKCVKELYERLLFLLKELEPWESKLLLATKKARIKLRKEHEEYKDSPQEENDDFWKTDNSDTDTDDGSGDDSDDEMSETDKSKSSTVKTGETPQITTAGDQESYEMDVSSRGRLRKRRVIPNNVEDQAKKRKVTNTTVTTASEHIPNILQRQSKTGQGSSLVTNLDQLKVLNIGGGIGLNSAGQILLQTTNTGSHALVTGLTPQAIASLRLGTKGTVIVPSTQQMKTPQKSQTQTRFMSMSSKQASHPVIQGLLSTRQPNILQKSGTNKTGAATLANQTGTTPINVLGVNQTVTPDSPQKQNLAVKTTTNSNQQNKVQYYAANLNSLPPAVLQQLVKSNSLKLQPGTNQSAMVLLAVNPQTSSGVSKVSTAQVIIRNTTTESQGIVSSVSHPSEGKNTTLLCAQNVDLLSQQHTQLKTATTIPTTADIENPSILSGISTVKLESSDSFTSNQSMTLNQQLSASGVLKSVVSSLAASQQQQQNLTVITTSLPSPTLQSGSDSIVTNAMSNLSSGTILTSSLGPLSPNRSVNKYSGSVTVKSLLEARKDAMRIEAQRQIAMKRVPTVVSTVQSPQLPATPLRVGGVQPVSMPSVVGKRSTVVLHPTTSGIKALKLPSKAVLDSAVQAVVTSVVTSLPTANIKVPSPVTMPSIQRRKNVTKTIMSMKAPIPTTPKVETKSLEVSCASMSSVGNAPIVTTTSSNNQTILTQIPSGNNQYIMANVKKNSVGGFITNSYTVQGQNPKNLMLKLLPQNMAATSQSGGVLQGYLTPQGIVISQASTTNPTTPQKSATLVSDGMQVINQNFQNPASTQINLLPNQVTACTFSMATSSTPSNSQTTSANAPNKQVDITLKPGNLPGTGTFTTNSSAKGSSVNSKISATKSGTINMATAVTQIDFKSAPISSSTVQSSTKKDVAPVIVSNGSLMVNNIVGSRLPGINISGQNLSATVPQIANINPVPQSPVQLTSPVIGQVANPIGNYVPAAVLGQLASPTGKVNLGQLTGLAISPNLQIASHQTLPVVSGNQLIGQPSLHVVGQPIPNVAHILNQAGIPLTNASQVLSQNVFTVVSTPQVTSQSVVSTLNSNSSISQVQPSVEQPTGLSLSTVKSSPVNLASNNSSVPIVGQQFGNIATPLLSPALKQPPVVMGSFGPGSSSELMKQLAAAQILGNSQVQLAGLKPQNSVQTNLSALSSNVPCSVTVSTPSQYYIQIPAAGSGAAAGQNVVRVQGQEPGQGQPMLLMSPQRGIMQGNAQLTAPTKPLTIQAGTPQTVMNVGTGSNSNQGQKQVQGQVTIPKVQLNFDVKPLVTIVPNSTNSTTSVVSSQGLPVVSSNAAGFTVFKNKVFISPSKLSTEAAELKTVDTKLTGIRPTLVAKPTNKQQQQQPQQQQQAGTQQGQKLILYNIGGNLVTPQGVQVTVENGVLKVVPKSKINIEGLTTNSQTEQGALVSTGSSQLQTLPSGLINITQNIGTSSQAAAGAASHILTNSTILAPQQDQHSIQQSSSKHSEQKQTSCEISSVKHGNLVQTETSQNPYMQDISVKVSLCDNSASALNVTSKSVENQGTKRLSTDTPEQEPNVISPKISKVQPVPSHLSGSHLKISQILAQKSTVMAVPKSGSGIVRLNVPGGTPVSPPMGSTTRNPGFVVVPGQTQVIFPHSNLSGASTAAAAKQLNVLSSHTGKVVPLQADVNIPSINSQTAPNIITSTQIYNSANPLIDINSSISSNSTSDQLLTSNSTNIKSEASKNMASVTDTVQEDGPETVAMVTGSASNNQEATGEQEAALNLLSLANQGFGT